MADDEIIIIVDDEPDTVDLSVEAGDNEDISADAPEVQNDVTEEVEGDKYYTDLAKQWAIASTLILGEDYSSKYYANQAKNYKTSAATSENNAAQSATDANTYKVAAGNSALAAATSEDNAQAWAEGTDEEVEALGGTHSAKEWASYIIENAPTVTAEQTATGAEITVTDTVHGTTTVELLNGADGQDGQDGSDGADGQDGFSPIATVTSTATGATISITDANGTTTANITNGIDGTDGTDGQAATIAVGTVTTGAAGSSATVTNSGTSSAAVFDFTIPKGDKGDKGDTGNTGATGATGATGNGIVGTQKTGTSGLVDTYTITYTNGNTDTFTVTNGQNGTGSVSDVRVNNVSVLTNNVANIDLTNYVDKTSNQSITGTKTFVGQKKIGFKQSNNTDKLGFTLYTNNNTEKGYLEFNPANTVDSVPLMTLGNWATSSDNLTHVGFRKYSGITNESGAYNLLAPLISEARTPFSLTTSYKNFYLPLGFTDGTTTVKTAKSGLVDLSSLLPNSAEWGNITGTLSDQTDLQNALNLKVNSSDLATVATTGSYTDLINKPYVTTNNGITYVGGDSSASTSGTALGYSAGTTGVFGISIGRGAKSKADYAYQIGLGNNTTSYSLSIGFGSAKTYTLLDGTTGLIPDARISTNIARTSQLPSLATTSTAGIVQPDGSTITVSNGVVKTEGVVNQQDSTITLKYWTGTKAQYDAITTKDNNTLYNITDDTDVTLTILETLYPVGAIYIGTMAVCPLATLGVGTWQLKTSRFLVDKYSNGSDWWELYSDGWCRQGGRTSSITTSQNTSNYVEITFLKPYANNNYTPMLSIYNGGSGYASLQETINSTSASGMRLQMWGQSGSGTNAFTWQAEGYTSETTQFNQWERIS